MKTFIVLLFLCAAAPAVVCAAAGTAGNRFLLLGVGGRAVGMGGAFTGVADDASAGYWNAAGLTGLTGTEFLSMYNHWFEGVNHLYAGLAFRLGEKGAAAVQANALTVGDIPRIDGAGVIAGVFGASDEAFTVSYARRIRERFSVSGSVKMIRETIEQESGSCFALDLGSLYRPSEKLGIGLTVQNIGSGIKLVNDASPLPTVIKAGLGYRIAAGKTNELTLAGDVALMPADKTVGANIGGEYVLSHTIALRTGAKLNGTVVPTLGVGFTLKNIRVDWATELFGDLGNPNRVSLTMKFGKGILR